MFYRPEENTPPRGGVNGGVNLLEYINRNPGKRVVSMIDVLNIPKRTIERQLKKLKEEDKIEFRGSPKIGGYFVR